jgi:hypothetical protein
MTTSARLKSAASHAEIFAVGHVQANPPIEGIGQRKTRVNDDEGVVSPAFLLGSSMSDSNAKDVHA